VPAVDATEQLLLLGRVQRGDEHAFEELYRHYRSRLFRFLINLTGRPQMVEEVLNDTMLAVWEKPDGFRGASKLSTWIFGIAYRKAMKALREIDDPIEYQPVQSIDEETASPHEASWCGQRDRLLFDTMQQLSAEHRVVVHLTYFHEMSAREIAHVMACPVGTVKTRMFHARRHLKRLMSGGSAEWL
jgi:RNA polymerase sigma-70 factor (ECF subfamily)